MTNDELSQLVKEMNVMYDNIKFETESKADRDRRLAWREFVKGIHGRYEAKRRRKARVVSNFLRYQSNKPTLDPTRVLLDPVA